MSHRLLAIVEKSVGGPDLTSHQIIEPQDVHWPMELQPLICPTLPEEHIHGVLLTVEHKKQWTMQLTEKRTKSCLNTVIECFQFSGNKLIELPCLIPWELLFVSSRGLFYRMVLTYR